MSLAGAVFDRKPRLRALLDHFAVIEDPREPWRVAHPLPEVLLLVVGFPLWRYCWRIRRDVGAGRRSGRRGRNALC
jgi:hypothetical protein